MKSYQINQIKLIVAITAELERQHPGLPADDRMTTVMKAANLIVEEYGRSPVLPQAGMTIYEWLDCDDVGASSKYMASVLSGAFFATHAHPRDPDDLGRCIRLVDSVPGLALPVTAMAVHGPEWAAVAEKWSSWRELYRNGQNEELYSAMRAAYAPAIR